MKREKQNLIGIAKVESLEDRRLMSSVQLVDGMLIIQGKTQGYNRISVTPDANGTTLFARADKAKGHFDIKDVKSIRVIGGELEDRVNIHPTFAQPNYVRVGAGNDVVLTGSGNDTVFGGAGGDLLIGGKGDDLLFGQRGPDKVYAGAGDEPEKVASTQNAKNKTAVSRFVLVDANTNKTIGTLVNGATLNLGKLPERMNVSVALQGSTGSVKFAYDGQDIRTENAAPYALAADDSGNFHGWSPRVGTHTLTATPYSAVGATGNAGTALTITFNVINDETSPAITGTGITPSEIDDEEENPNSVDNTNAPNAIIELMDASVPAGHAIHVNALKTALNEGDLLHAKFQWNFGDAGSKYNTLNGFTAAHAYKSPGTYTITLKVTNGAGKVTTVSRQVTITEADRRFVYVSPKGNDANNGSSQVKAVKTFARASQLVGDNTEILFERGATYSVKEAMNIGKNNVVVGAYGQGNKPVLKYTGGMDYGTIFWTLEAKDVLVRDLAFDSTSTEHGHSGYNDAVRVGGTNVTVRDCTFINVGSAVNTNGFPEGVLVQDNVAPNKTSIRAFFVWVQGSDMVVLGNQSKDSLNAHNLRVGGADRINIQYNDFTNLDETAGKRGTLTLHKGDHMYVANNKLTDGALAFGPLDNGSGLDDKGARLKWAVVEDNVINSLVFFGHGTDHLMFRNNVVQRDNDTAMDMPGYSDQYDRGISDVHIINNTVINKGTWGKFLKVGGPIDRVTLTNNVYVAPNLTTGYHNTAPMQVNNRDLAGFRLIANNIWPEPTILEGADGGINYVGTTGDARGYKTAAEWEAYSVVQHDQYKDVTLGSTYKVTLGGVTAGASLKKAA